MITAKKLDKIMDDIEAVRAKNNKLWMRIVRLAGRSHPEELGEILGQINLNDQKISKLMGEIK